jgi:hypothetical protein
MFGLGWIDKKINPFHQFKQLKPGEITSSNDWQQLECNSADDKN